MGIQVLLCGGSTAGHIEPALNIANELSKNGAQCEFVGTIKGLDRELITRAGFTLHLIKPVPLPRTFHLATLLFPFRLIYAIGQSLRICRAVQPDVIVGFGSFVALPVYIASWLLRIPLVIHEANAKTGIANSVGAKIACRRFQTVEGAIKDATTVGTPLRPVYDDFNRQNLRVQGMATFELKEGLQTLLVFGGSQGARRINEGVNEISDTLTGRNLQILHIVGKNNQDQMSPRRNHVYREYSADMPLAYAVADLAICRSGALTVAEIAATNTPAIFIPFPIGNGEQEKNAGERVQQGAARMVRDQDLTPDFLLREIENALTNLGSMQRAGESHRPVNATKVIAGEIVKVAAL